MAIRELTLQNERLTEDIRVATLREEELEAENQTLREKISARSSSMHAHVGQLELLQQEVGQLYIQCMSLLCWCDFMMSSLTMDALIIAPACWLRDLDRNVIVCMHSSSIIFIILHIST